MIKRLRREATREEHANLRIPEGDRKVIALNFHDDNEAMVSVCRTGKNPTMRHLGKVHGISLSLLCQETKKAYVNLGYISTDIMAADIFTKFYPRAKSTMWVSVRKLINLLAPSEIVEMTGNPGNGWKHMQENPGRYVDPEKVQEAESKVLTAAAPCGQRLRVGTDCSGLDTAMFVVMSIALLAR